MARAPFRIFKRESKDRATGKAVTRYCARFFDEDGTILRTKTLEASSATKAALEAKGLLDKGGSISSDPLALDFLEGFWKPDSDYATMKRLRGRPLSAGYIKVSSYLVGKHLAEPLHGVLLSSLTVPRMEKTIRAMAAAGTGHRTINAVIASVRVPVSDWARKHRVPDPLEYMTKLAETPRERGTLSLAEIKAIIGLGDESPRAVAAVLLGALCGLRLGEMRGLQWSDVDRENHTLHLIHNYLDDEGMKAPKCGSKRDVPLPDLVLDALDLCLRTSPYTPSFVLWNDKKTDLPFAKKSIENGLARILRGIGVDDEKQASRNLVVHGLRHTFVSLSRASGLPDFAVMRLAGHKSLVMTERYSHSDKVVDLATARLAMNGALSKAGGA